ncbi:hypothetical protein PTTG_31043, partial [Puccinia triticina 1-1 BBBD Race 1]
ESGKNCRKFLPLVLFADRISTKRTTGYSPYELIFGQRAALPIDLDIESYLGVDWEEVRDTTDLLVARSKQLERSEDSRRLAYKRMMNSREESVRYWQEKNFGKFRHPLQSGDLVLAYNRSLEVQWGSFSPTSGTAPTKLSSRFKGAPTSSPSLTGRSSNAVSRRIRSSGTFRVGALLTR